MSGGRDEIEKRMHAIISETGVSLDAGLFRKNVIILTFEVPNYFAE